MLITQGDTHSMMQEILSAKGKPDRPMQNVDGKMDFWWLWWIGFFCWTVLTFLNTPGSNLTQAFNSQTLSGDL